MYSRVMYIMYLRVYVHTMNMYIVFTSTQYFTDLYYILLYFQYHIHICCYLFMIICVYRSPMFEPFIVYWCHGNPIFEGRNRWFSVKISLRPNHWIILHHFFWLISSLSLLLWWSAPGTCAQSCATSASLKLHGSFGPCRPGDPWISMEVCSGELSTMGFTINRD